MGTRFACSCLERPGERTIGTINFDEGCQNEYDEDDCAEGCSTIENECREIAAFTPIVLNVINGVRYCGKPGKHSLSEATRPNKDEETDDWKCPPSHKACNEEFFARERGADYVICYPENEEKDLYCPVTSISFDVPTGEESLYEWQPINSGKEGDLRGLYISKKVMQYGI